VVSQMLDRSAHQLIELVGRLVQTDGNHLFGSHHWKYCYDHDLSRGHRNAWNLQVRPVTIRTAVHAASVMLTGMAQ
jgi:hypothetical protein